MNIKDLELKIKFEKAHITIEDGYIAFYSGESVYHGKKKEDNVKQLVLLQDELLKLKEQEKAKSVYDKNWRPEPGEKYWHITEMGNCEIQEHEKENDFDEWQSTTGNTYRTGAYCEKAIQAAELIGEINQFARDANGEWKTISNPDKGYRIYEDGRPNNKLPMFKTNVISQIALDKFGDRLIELQAYI